MTYSTFVSSKTSHCSSILALTRNDEEALDALAIDEIIRDARVYGDFQKAGMKKFIDALKPGEIHQICREK